MHAHQTQPAVTRLSWLLAGTIGLVGGVLFMLAVGLGTGITQFNHQASSATVARLATGAGSSGPALVVPTDNPGSAGTTRPSAAGATVGPAAQPPTRYQDAPSVVDPRGAVAADRGSGGPK